MSLLDQEENASLDISAGGLVLAYTHVSDTPRIALCRITLGNADQPIAGNAVYTVQMTINDGRVQPDSSITVLAGLTRIILQSRELLLAENDEVNIFVDGPPADTAVYSLAELIDLTPVTRSEIMGTGAVAIDHDFGGADALVFQTDTGHGIENAIVQAFLSSDWAAGRRSATYVQGATITVLHGRWLAPIMLDPGDYTLLYFREGVYKASTVAITVA